MIVTPLVFPILVWGAIILGSALAGVAGGLVAAAFDDPKKNKLGILGMQQAGKTRFLRFLQNKPFIEEQTNKSTYEEFKYRLSNDKDIIIKSGVDIGGGNLYRTEYNKIIDESDVVLYFFDIDRYLKNIKDNDNEYYQRACNSRFEHIYSNIKQHNEEFLKAVEKKKELKNQNKEKELLKKLNDKLEKLKSTKSVRVIATHKDRCSFSENEMKQRFDILVQNKSYKDMLNEVQYVNLTNNLEIKKLVNTIFNNK